MIQQAAEASVIWFDWLTLEISSQVKSWGILWWVFLLLTNKGWDGLQSLSFGVPNLLKENPAQVVLCDLQKLKLQTNNISGSIKGSPVVCRLCSDFWVSFLDHRQEIRLLEYMFLLSTIVSLKLLELSIYVEAKLQVPGGEEWRRLRCWWKLIKGSYGEMLGHTTCDFATSVRAR
jgi:hypothetical protein